MLVKSVTGSGLYSCDMGSISVSYHYNLKVHPHMLLAWGMGTTRFEPVMSQGVP